MTTLAIQFAVLDARAACAVARSTMNLLDVPQFQFPLLDAIRRQHDAAEQKLTAALANLDTLAKEMPE